MRYAAPGDRQSFSEPGLFPVLLFHPSSILPVVSCILLHCEHCGRPEDKPSSLSLNDSPSMLSKSNPALYPSGTGNCMRIPDMQDPFTHLSGDFFPVMLQKLLINTECIHIHPILHQRITFAFSPVFLQVHVFWLQCARLKS